MTTRRRWRAAWLAFPMAVLLAVATAPKTTDRLDVVVLAQTGVLEQNTVTE